VILIVCPNLAVDVTLEIATLERGGVHRALSARRQAGGKGVNVARALKGLGERPFVLGFAGGRSGEIIADGLEADGIEAELVPIPGESRSCTILLEPDGTATVVNEPGPDLDLGAAHVPNDSETRLLARFQARLGESETQAVALMGSLPPGLSADVYAEMVARSRERGRFVLVDTSGEPLRHALTAGPDLVKPNREEAEALLGVELDAGPSRRKAVDALRRMGASTSILTLGGEGFLLAGEDGLLARCSLDSPADLRLGNPTGAGDSLAAGFLAAKARGYPLKECARLAAAAAAASLAEGYGKLRAKDLRVEDVRFEELARG
jgi:1-phosphofructokinase family hexose kinase